MGYTFGYQLGYTGVGRGFNICITELGDDGIITWYGYKLGSFGAANPAANVLDQAFYSFKWDASGNIIASFGSAGNEQVPDVPIIFVYPDKITNNPIELVWDEVTSTYNGTDIARTTAFIADYVSGRSRQCFFFEVTPIQIISYDYNLGSI